MKGDLWVNRIYKCLGQSRGREPRSSDVFSGGGVSWGRVVTSGRVVISGRVVSSWEGLFVLSIKLGGEIIKDSVRLISSEGGGRGEDVSGSVAVFECAVLNFEVSLLGKLMQVVQVVALVLRNDFFGELVVGSESGIDLLVDHSVNF